jgi:hypothetical protein
MPCFHPLQAARYRENTSDKWKIFFQNFPPAAEKINLPCGRCIGCRLEYSRQWATRIMHEASLHQANSFITLTYDYDHLPWDGSLNKTHFQKFMKRLRKRIGVPIKYYHCGEYGEKDNRPHYHACIFGYDFPDRSLWQVFDDRAIDNSALLSDVWGQGFVSVGDLTFESAAYVARYCVKKINGSLREKPDPKTGLRPYDRVHQQTGEIIEVEPEYATMSRGGRNGRGIGYDWFDRFNGDVFPSDEVIVNGFATKPPRYYDNLFSASNPEDMEKIKMDREEAILGHRVEYSTRRLEAKEKVALARLNLKSRKI